MEARKAKSDHAFAIDNHKTAKSNLALAQKINDKTRIKYQEGVASSMELSQSDEQYQRKQGDYINALYQLLNSKSNLDKALSKY